MNPIPLGYTQSADGLFRKRITFETNEPGVVQVKVLVRDAAGTLVRMNYREDRIRLAAPSHNAANFGKTKSFGTFLESVISGETKTGETSPGSR